ncbi:hypothetical protein ACH5RR_006625 [Cinchona calisaya]|uniref:BHLH domain-containing protein n=1 Tax=Cinchona calisaya TaxID=153742 RepID=A0ABD3APX5_9GENT
MQPCSREMQAMNLLVNQQQSQMSLQDGLHHFDSTTSSDDDFLQQMLTSNPSSWPLPDLKPQQSPWDPLLPAAAQTPLYPLEDQSASKLRQLQIGSAKTSMLQQQFMLSRDLAAAAGNGDGLRSPPGGSSSGLLGMPMGLAGNGDRNDVSGDGSNPGGMMQTQIFGAPVAATSGSTGTAGGGGATAQPRQQRVRARRGQATDPHSIAERLRRERIAERMKSLQELVPNANKTDKASMLDEIIDYVKFLQLQVKVLSMSRLGGATAVAPLVADMSSEGGGDCVNGRNNNGTQTASSSNNESLTVTEHQVAKLMEDDMGSAMQYLQGKGLCLMPISLATAISTATCQTRNPMNPNLNGNGRNNPLLGIGGGFNGNGVGEAGGPSSPSMSVLTVQSATMGNGGGCGEPSSVKDATSVSKS